MGKTRLIKSGVLTRGIATDARIFTEGAHAAARMAAEKATTESREIFNRRLSKRPNTNLARPSRPTTKGKFASHIAWTATKDAERDGFKADTERLSAAAPYWLVQEIGSGASASIGKVRGGQGRSGPREKGNITIPKQAGRILPRGLVWSGNNPPNDQIEPRQGRPGPRITIRNEIKGKGYMRIGGNAGFALYKLEMEKAFRRAFGHHPKQ